MKTCYVNLTIGSIADLVAPDGAPDAPPHWIITRVNVPVRHRGQGYASELLKQITDDADREHVSLMLEVSPSDGLGYSQLVAWYRRHGFHLRHSLELGFHMVREPHV